METKCNSFDYHLLYSVKFATFELLKLAIKNLYLHIVSLILLWKLNHYHQRCPNKVSLKVSPNLDRLRRKD